MYEESKLYRCPICEGRGRIANPAFNNGFTQDEWYEMGPESQERYLSGAYDVRCYCCKGDRVAEGRQIRLYREEVEHGKEFSYENV